MSIDHVKIENEALAILEANNITQPVVNVAQIAKERGIEIKEIEMPKDYSGVAGFFDKNKNIIYVDVTDKPVRKLFTIAHELGHIFLGHQNYNVLFRIPNKLAHYSKEEKEANSFASSLLMPEFMIREYMDKYNLSKSDYKTMSEIFGVPILAMKVRLEEHLK
jgi:Zn-dependent peptidase ImmA (M78 family)